MSAILRALMPCPVKVEPVPTHICQDDSETMGRPRGAYKPRASGGVRRHYAKIKYRGRTLSVGQWAKRCNMTPQALYKRLNMGWAIGKALSKPPQARRE